MSWEALFHLAAADAHAELLDRCTPALFRSQLLGLRPPELIAADIRMAARSLAVTQDPMALVRLVIAAGELTQRGYHMPEREQFVKLLLANGRWRVAVDFLFAEADDFGTGRQPNAPATGRTRPLRLGAS